MTSIGKPKVGSSTQGINPPGSQAEHPLGRYSVSKKTSSVSLIESSKSQTLQAAAPSAPEGSFELDCGRAGVFTLQQACLPKIKGPSEASVKLEIAQKIERGSDLLNQLLGDKKPSEPCSMQAMTDLMWFLQAKAEASVGAFQSGGMSIEDPEGRIAKFLDTHTEMYQRISTHLPEFQAAPGGVQRGIDNNKKSVKTLSDMAGIFPHQRRTLLYGPMKAGVSPDGIAPLGKNRIYLKIETYGAFVYKPKNGETVEGLRESRKMNVVPDLKNAVGHAGGFLEAMERQIKGTQNDSGSRRENTPSSVTEIYNGIVEHFQSNPDLKSRLLKGNPLAKSSGIRTMVKNLEDTLAYSVLSKDQREFLEEKQKKFTKELTKLKIDDHLDSRIGGEVIFDKEDF